MASTAFKENYAQLLQKVEAGLKTVKMGQSKLAQAAEYSLAAGGKRLRPVLVLAAAAQGTSVEALPAALAIECVHTFSLIHDDMPCIDNATLRRGKPCCHKVYGEAVGLLAGDQLLNEAYRLVTQAYAPEMAGKLCAILAQTSYWLLEGEHADIEAEKLHESDVDINFIYQNKTAVMISAPIKLGLTLAGWSAEKIAPYAQAAEQVGVAFQIIDDLLDAESDAATMGKDVGMDEKKKTFLKIKGKDWCVAHAAHLSAQARATLSTLPKPEFILDTVEWLLERKS